MFGGRSAGRLAIAGVLLASLLGALEAPAAAQQALPAVAPAGVTLVQITRREPFAGGMSFGAVGPYEKLAGTVFLELDPADPHNAVIQDKDRAPLNERGRIEYSTDIYILKPVDMGKGNGKIFFEVNNRGNKIALPLFNDTPAEANNNDPSTLVDAGNGFLMREGYAIVWAGWQGDVASGGNRLTIRVPTVTSQGATITGTVAEQYDVSRHIPVSGATSLRLSGQPNFRPYPTASLDTSTATLTWREHTDSPETVIPSSQWAFATCERNRNTGAIENVVSSPQDICYFGGFDPNKLYQLVYQAKDPRLMSLGYAVTRDVLSFLRYSAADQAGNPNPLGAGIGDVYCLGISSSGMYVRDWVYLGFNEDPAGRRVCDGLMAHIGGAFRLHLNTRFTQPDIYSRQDLWAGLYPMATFPYSYAMSTDPLSGRTDGILKRPHTDPLIIQTDTSQEYWQFGASVVTHDTLGRPLTLPDTARYYLIASSQHFPTAGAPPTRGICQQLSNPLHAGVFLRALLVNLDQWVTHGTPPPPSEYPRGTNGTLVPPDAGSTGFPAIPGVTYGGLINTLAAKNYGPTFTSTGGVISLLPPMPIPGVAPTLLVPKVDADGNDVAGLRRPDDLQTPLATYTGWNLRRAPFREGETCGLTGSYVPFARTKEERQARNDPRLSFEERYASHADYVGQVAANAQAWKARRLLLDEDVERVVAAADRRNVPGR